MDSNSEISKNQPIVEDGDKENEDSLGSTIDTLLEFADELVREAIEDLYEESEEDDFVDDDDKYILTMLSGTGDYLIASGATGNFRYPGYIFSLENVLFGPMEERVPAPKSWGGYFTVGRMHLDEVLQNKRLLLPMFFLFDSTKAGYFNLDEDVPNAFAKVAKKLEEENISIKMEGMTDVLDKETNINRKVLPFKLTSNGVELDLELDLGPDNQWETVLQSNSEYFSEEGDFFGGGYFPGKPGMFINVTNETDRLYLSTEDPHLKEKLKLFLEASRVIASEFAAQFSKENVNIEYPAVTDVGQIRELNNSYNRAKDKKPDHPDLEWLNNSGFFGF